MPSGAESFQNVSDAMRAAMYVLHAPARNAFLTIRLPVLKIKLRQQALRRICSILSALFMLPDAVLTAASVHAYVPQHIPLHLLNRKFIKDINELYGEYQAGADPESRSPVVDFTKNDADAGNHIRKGR